MLTNSKNVEAINQGRKVETCSSEILQIPAAQVECRAGDCHSNCSGEYLKQEKLLLKH